jgi:hypothetical protein
VGRARVLLEQHKEVGLELIDLAGLGNRYIAKNRQYPKRINHYILVDKQPDFVFGSTTVDFAAVYSRFFEMWQFRKDYVCLEFPGQPQMSANLGDAYLNHVRRELVKPGLGIELVYEDNKLVKVIVSPL